MRNHVQVAVIGGGVVGASVLYHLTKAGWKDVLLIERAELTSGSSWHAAGGMHTLNGDPNVARLQQYTIDLYQEIEEISGISCGVHVSGGLLLAGTPGARRLAADGGGARPLPRHAPRADLGVGGQEAASAARGEAFPRRDPRSHRRARGPVRRDARLREIRADRRRRDRATEPCRRHEAAAGRDLGRRHREGHGSRRARRQCGRPVGARSRAVRRARAADPRDGAPVLHYGRPAGAERTAGAQARHRLRGRDLHAPGRAGHAARHPTSARACRGRRRRRPGISARTCCRTTSSASPRASPSRPNISPPSKVPASARSSMAHSRSRRTAIRWSGRSGACGTTGSPAA